MRPQSIVRFERVVLAMIVVGLVSAVLNMEQVTRAAAVYGFGEGLILAMQAISIAVLLLLMWLIARRRSVVAKWIYVLLGVAGLVMAAFQIGGVLRQPAPLLVIEAVQWLLTIFSIWLLFRPDAKAWFAHRDDPADPAT